MLRHLLIGSITVPTLCLAQSQILIDRADAFVTSGRDTVSAGGPSQSRAVLDYTDSRGSVGRFEVNARDGALHAYAQASSSTQPDCNPKLSNTCGWSIWAQGSFLDTVTFRRQDLADPAQVKFKFEVDGTIDWGPYGRGGEAWFSYYVGPVVGGWSGPSGHRIYPPSAAFGGAVEIPAGQEAITLYVYAGLKVGAFTGGTADFSNTARFKLDLPPGVTFTSASGQFMADHFPPAPVPEPASFALMGVGLPALVWLRRRKSASQHA